MDTAVGGTITADDGATGPDWFSVAEAVGDDLVPSRADWVVMHVRTRVLDVVRAGVSGSLADAGVGEPVDGEQLSLMVLRHRDSDLEVALHRLVLALAPKVGDPYGSGRVSATGRSRFAPSVDAAHLRAIATGPDNLRALQQLDLGGAVIAPVATGPTVIGALNLVWSEPHGMAGDVLADAERLGREIGSALDGARPATAQLRSHPVRGSAAGTWTPPGEGNPAAAARAWVRRLLPEMLDRRARESLAEELDLVVSELVGNALRHAGGVRGVALGPVDGCVRLTVLDEDDRSPTLREPSLDLESGRGLLLVDALCRAWGVDHDLARGGKGVWAELSL